MNTIPAGKYYVGDLCYVMHEEWDEVCGLIFPDNSINALDGVFSLKDGRKFAMFSTAHGDGHYLDNQGNSAYSVDSGSIGCILMSDIDMANAENRHHWLGSVHEFTSEFDCFEEKGIITFGHVEINTEDEVDDEYGEEE